MTTIIINYKITTTYQCEDGSQGIAFGYQNACCCADAMRQERERIAESHGPIHVVQQHGDVSEWHLKRVRCAGVSPIPRYGVRADHDKRIYEVYNVATGETVKSFAYRARSELDRGRAHGQATIAREQLIRGGDHA